MFNVTKFKKANKWARVLTKRDLQHLIDASENKVPRLWVAKANAKNPDCIECRHIGNVLSNRGII